MNGFGAVGTNDTKCARDLFWLVRVLLQGLTALLFEALCECLMASGSLPLDVEGCAVESYLLGET